MSISAICQVLNDFRGMPHYFDIELYDGRKLSVEIYTDCFSTAIKDAYRQLHEKYPNIKHCYYHKGT